MPDKYKPPYAFSVTIGETCARQMRTFPDLAEKLRMPVEDLMRQCNGKVSPSKALVKGLAKEQLDIDESFLNRLAEEEFMRRIYASDGQCVGEMIFCVHEPQYAAQDSSFGYNIWRAKFYLRHTADMTLYADKDSAVISGSVWAPCWFSLYSRCI